MPQTIMKLTAWTSKPKVRFLPHWLYMSSAVKIDCAQITPSRLSPTAGADLVAGRISRIWLHFVCISCIAYWRWHSFLWGAVHTRHVVSKWNVFFNRRKPPPPRWVTISFITFIAVGFYVWVWIIEVWRPVTVTWNMYPDVRKFKWIFENYR